MTDDRLLDRLRELDPATSERVASAARGADDLRRTIQTEEVDQLAIRRRGRRNRVGVAIAAAAVTAALLVPLILLLPLGDDDPTVGGTTPATSTPPASTSEPSAQPDDPGPLDPIEVTEPAGGSTVTSPVRVSGTADVFEATVTVRIVDAVNNVIAETFATATCGSGCRGDFSIELAYSVGAQQPGEIQVFEVSAEDGTSTNTVRVPVTLTPGPQDPVAAAVEGDWTAPDGSVAPTGDPGEPLVLDTFEGADHCGWTSITFLHFGWSIGTGTDGSSNGARQYLRDPQNLLGSRTEGAFRGDASLPGDATDTGYHRGDWQLWIAPSDQDRAVYLVNTDPAAQGVVERWPRASAFIACD